VGAAQQRLRLFFFTSAADLPRHEATSRPEWGGLR